MACCNRADFVAKLITQHHIHGGADDVAGLRVVRNANAVMTSGALQRLSERCAARAISCCCLVIGGWW